MGVRCVAVLPKDNLDIRYIKLHFRIQFIENVILPENKVSALRGGMGEMLLRANCIKNRKCESCDFEPECLVRRTMYSKYEIQPAFATKGDSIGYVLECENYDTEFLQGECLNFQLILFGKTIVYFNQFLQSFYQLGMYGLGKEKARFQIVGITNSMEEPILEEGSILMKNYKVMLLRDYVAYRKRSVEKMQNRIHFHTPVTLKHRGQQMEVLDMEAVTAGILRKLYMLNCFEGNPHDELRWAGEMPYVLKEESKPVTVMRYSGTQKSHMPLRGIRGDLILESVPEELKTVLYAGELIHIGKNTRFGFGRYTLR